jgi:hypothetical protein
VSSGLVEGLALGLALVAFIGAVSIENVDWRRHLGGKKDVGSDAAETNVISFAVARDASLAKDAEVPAAKRASRSLRDRDAAGAPAHANQETPIAADG